jgi:hypothetical protein
MIKKIILLSAICSQILISCEKEEVSTPETVPTSNPVTVNELSTWINLPYSALTPEQQKLKLETEANAALVEMDKLKTSSAIEAIQNLESLLSISSIDFLNGKTDNGINDLINVSEVYGIYTWNNVNNTWTKTVSTSDLKFVFPAKKNQTTNNAVLSSKAVSSGIKETLGDSDEIYLPSFVDATLSINNTQAGSIVLNAKYTNGNSRPEETGYKIVLNDGYVWENNAKKGTPNSFNTSFLYNNKNIMSFVVDSNAKIDELLDNDTVLNSYRGKGNVLVKVLDNFVIIGNMDLEAISNDEEAFDKNNKRPDYRSKNYYTDTNIYEKNKAESDVSIYNKNTKLILVSRKDGSKVADFVLRASKGYLHTDNQEWIEDKTVPVYGGYWSWNWQSGTVQTIQYYNTNTYLRFKDNTEVETNVYFSTGFDALETKFTDFIDSFNRK